jgi:hypothetical protein
MAPDLTALFLLAGASSTVTIATIMYVGFPRPETRFTLVVTLLLSYALLTLAPVAFFCPLTFFIETMRVPVDGAVHASQKWGPDRRRNRYRF